MAVCYYPVTYELQIESTLYSLPVKELLASSLLPAGTISEVYVTKTRIEPTTT